MKLIPKRREETKEEKQIRREGEAQLRRLPKLTDEHQRAQAKARCPVNGPRHRFMELGDGFQCPKCGGWAP